MNRLVLFSLLFFLPSVAFAQAQPHIIMILGDDALRGHIAEYRTDSVDTAWTGAGDTATPNLDTIAQAGVMVDHLITSQVCSPSRATLLGYGYAHMPSNLMGGAHDMDVPILHTWEVRPSFKTLVDYAHDLSYEVVFIGKSHLTRLSWREQTEVEDDTPGTSDTSWVKAMGFDRATYMIGNTRHASYLGVLPIGSPTLTADDVDCLGHNDFVVCDIDGLCSQQTALHSTVYFMNVLQDDLTNHTNTKTLYIFEPPAAHSPFEFGTANNCATGTRTQDDRVSGSACGTTDCVYEEFITNLDTEIGAVMADMNAGTGFDIGGAGDLDTICFAWDNGVPIDATNPADCENSEGVKNTPFPCGTEGGLICGGSAVTATPGHITGLHSMADIPKTLEQMMGGTGKGQTEAGHSIMDCLDGTVSLASCPSLDFVPYTEWSPVGSAKTKGTMPDRMPDCAVDAAADWTKLEVGGWTHGFSSRFLLHRIYAMDGTCNFTEALYDTNGTTDRYVSTASGLIADSSLIGPTQGAIDPDGVGVDWVSDPGLGNETNALAFLTYRTNLIVDNQGKPPLQAAGVDGAF